MIGSDKNLIGTLEKNINGISLGRKTSEKYKEVYDSITEGGNKPYPSIDYKVSLEQKKSASQTINVV